MVYKATERVKKRIEFGRQWVENNISGGGSVSLLSRFKATGPGESLEILNNINDPILIFDDGTIVFANEKAAELFNYESTDEMIMLKLGDITSVYEKKHEYAYERSNSFVATDNREVCNRFRWIHMKRSGEHFYSEVISIQLPQELSKDWPNCQCVIITDLSSWNELKSQAEKSFLPTRNLINNISQVILIIDPETGLILDANSFASEFYGYTVHQLRRLNIGDLNILPMEDIKREMQKAKEEKRGHFLFKHRKASGEIVSVKVMSGPVQYSQRTALYSIIAPETSLLKEVVLSEHEKVAANEQNIFEALFHNIQLPAVIFNTDMRIRAVNTSFLKEFEYNISEVMNHHITPLICPWEYIEEAEFFHGLILKGNNIFEEVLRKTKSGRLKSYKVNGIPLMYNGHVSAVVAVYLDVDAEKKAFTKLHLINKIFENIDEGMLITDASGRITWVNHAFENITGFSFDYVVGEMPSILRSGKHDSLFYQVMWHDLNARGYWEGEVLNKKSSGDEYQAWLTIVSVKDKKDQVTNYVGVMNDITKYKAQEEKINHLAKTDVLTGLMNRSTFIDSVDLKLKQTPQNVKHAFLFIDLDDFQKINDMHGHDQGDVLLKIISYRLRSTFKSRDIVARLGGDEFIVMLDDIGIRQIPEVIDRTIRVIERSIDLDNQVVHMEVSIGISIYPDDAKNLGDLMKNADIALYHAKETNGSSYEYYSMEIEKKFKTINKLEKCLKLALKNDEFDVYYQGIVGGQSEKFTSAEALIRWTNPDLGRVSPEEFIPVAERLGIMPDLGLWVIERVLSDIKTWNYTDCLKEGIAINISVKQLEDPAFCKKVKTLLTRYNVPVDFIEFEITESIYIRNFDKVVKVLDELHDIGIKLTMDDFGTGYSSLSMIHKLRLSKIKIDRSFINELPVHDKSIELTNTIINLAQNLNFKVVAEGVENRDQVEFLKARECDFIQGYYYSKPVSGSNFSSLLRSDICYNEG